MCGFLLLTLATGAFADERARIVAASVAAAVLAVERGARIVRVHDVAATVAALALWRAARADNRADLPSTRATP